MAGKKTDPLDQMVTGRDGDALYSLREGGEMAGMTSPIVAQAEEVPQKPTRVARAPKAKKAPAAEVAATAPLDADTAFILKDVIATGQSNQYAQVKAEQAALGKESPNLASLVNITNANPGAIFGNLAQFNEMVSHGNITTRQSESFVNAGKALVEEMIRNQKLGATMGKQVDLNHDGMVTKEEYGSVAAALDWKHTVQVASGMSKEDSLRKIDKQLGNDDVIARANKILTAMEYGPVADGEARVQLSQNIPQGKGGGHTR